jgi:metal-sulfur cluster biosynthetic enzyme
MDQEKILDSVMDRLAYVIDPETGVDVVRMRLVQDIKLDEKGKISYIFRPSSPLCPIAVPLALNIIEAIKKIPEIKKQDITVVDYLQADMLNDLLKTVV